MSEEYPDKSLKIVYNFLWLGFLLYISSYVVAQSDKVNFILINVFQIIGLLMLIPAAVFIIRPKIDNKYLGLLYTVFLIWSLIVVARGVEFSYTSIKQLLFRPKSGLFVYLVPLALLFPRDKIFLKKIFDVIIIMGILYIIISFIFIKDLLISHNESKSREMIEHFSQYLSFPAGFILLTYTYHSNKRKLFALFIVAFTFLLAVLRARRGLMFITFSSMFFGYLVYQYVNRVKIINTILSAFLIVIVSVVALKIYDANRKSTFSLITERIGHQTRSEVEEYFYMDLKTKDWIFGKGLEGEYFCPGVVEGDRISIYRTVIETGFLQIILNGGILSLGLMLLIMVPALFKGLFYLKNLMSKAAAIWIILFLLYSYPGTPTMFSMSYILTWISIGICYSAEFRMIPEEKMTEMIGNNKVSLSEDPLVQEL